MDDSSCYIFQSIFLCVPQNKEKHTSLDQHVNNNRIWNALKIFGVNFSLVWGIVGGKVHF